MNKTLIYIGLLCIILPIWLLLFYIANSVTNISDIWISIGWIVILALVNLIIINLFRILALVKEQRIKDD